MNVHGTFLNLYSFEEEKKSIKWERDSCFHFSDFMHANPWPAKLVYFVEYIFSANVAFFGIVIEIIDQTE